MSTIDVKIPALGDFKDVPVIDVLVKPGDPVQANDALVTLESDKATMDVPAPSSGTVRDLRVKVGDRVSEGAVVVVLDEVDGASHAASETAPAPPQAKAATEAPAEAPAAQQQAAPLPRPPQAQAPAAAPAAASVPPPPAAAEAGPTHASPSVRKLARELGVELSRVEGSGPRGRILQADVQRFVKEALTTGAGAGARGVGGLDLPPWPKVDFARFGPVEVQPLSRIQRLSRGNLARNWVMIPHVTQHDEADITDLESFRVELSRDAAVTGVKVTLLAFAVKACVAALKRYPQLNASLDGDRWS